MEKLIRYCVRPAFASENLYWNGPWLIYRLPKPCHTGKRFIQLEPIEFIDKIAALILPAKRHRHHYHGAFAPQLTIKTLDYRGHHPDVVQAYTHAITRNCSENL